MFQDPYEEENLAEQKQYLIYCFGRLQELQSLGLVEGQQQLTDDGWEKYKDLKIDFKPDKEKVREALLYIGMVPRKELDTTLEFVMPWDKERKQKYYDFCVEKGFDTNGIELL